MKWLVVCALTFLLACKPGQSPQTKPLAHSQIQSQLSEAKALYNDSNYEQAAEAYHAVLKQDTNNVDALEGRGLSLLKQGKVESATKLFTEVLKQDALRWRTLNAIGVAYALQKDMPQAKEYFTAALEVSPETPVVLNNTGLSYAFQGEYASAIRELHRAAQMLPEDSRKKERVELNLALVYGLAGEAEQAKKLLQRHLSQAEVYNNLGVYARLTGDTDLARSYLNKALTASPTFYANAWENLQDLPDYNKANELGNEPPEL